MDRGRRRTALRRASASPQNSSHAACGRSGTRRFPYSRSGLLPGPHASPGLNRCGSRPSLTSWPKDCDTPPGPFGATLMSRLSGAVGSSFRPEKTQIELACAGPAVGAPVPVISPAKAAVELTPTKMAHPASAIDALRMSPPPRSGSLDRRTYRRRALGSNRGQQLPYDPEKRLSTPVRRSSRAARREREATMNRANDDPVQWGLIGQESRSGDRQAWSAPSLKGPKP
jgi:hypothetical protein